MRNVEQKDEDRQPRDPSFYRPCGAGGGDDSKRCVVTRIGRSGWAPASTRPSRDGGVCGASHDLCHSCPALCAIINYPRAARGSATIEHAAIYQKWWCVLCQP